MQKEAKNPVLQVARPIGNRRRLHSIHGLLSGRTIEGGFEARDQPYRFSFVPATAAIADGQLVLNGRLTVDSPQHVRRFMDGATARLIATQGGVGALPARRQLLAGAPQTSQTSTSDQKLEQEAGPQTELQPGLHAFENPKFDEQGRPVVESTGPLSFVGVLYFSLAPLAAATLGVPLDLSKVQLNLRLAPTDDQARDLRDIFSDLTAALYGQPRDERAAGRLIEELNRIFKG
jgi:hypothetical protein